MNKFICSTEKTYAEIIYTAFTSIIKYDCFITLGRWLFLLLLQAPGKKMFILGEQKGRVFLQSLKIQTAAPGALDLRGMLEDYELTLFHSPTP